MSRSRRHTVDVADLRDVLEERHGACRLDRSRAILSQSTAAVEGVYGVAGLQKPAVVGQGSVVCRVDLGRFPPHRRFPARLSLMATLHQTRIMPVGPNSELEGVEHYHSEIYLEYRAHPGLVPFGSATRSTTQIRRNRLLRPVEGCERQARRAGPSSPLADPDAGVVPADRGSPRGRPEGHRLLFKCPSACRCACP
jgi:hypothetical protein